MAQRKGQFIFNYLRNVLDVPQENIGNYLFTISDEKFEMIEHEYRKYCIPLLHSPTEWKGEIQKIGEGLYNRYREEGLEESKGKQDKQKKDGKKKK